MKAAMIKLICQVQTESETINLAAASVNECVAKLNDDIAGVSAATQELSAGMEETSATTAMADESAAEIHAAVQHITSRSQDGAQNAAEIKERAEQTNKKIKSAQEKAVQLKNEIQQDLEKALENAKVIDQIYDLFAVRILVESVKDCYAALGVIHEMYKPIPGRFKDYIAMPKPNMYQSLHTTLIGPKGTPFEIQIRTWEMHRTAEYGIAAHWKYKESGGSIQQNMEGKDSAEAKLTWLRQILEWQQDESDNREFMNLLKSDLEWEVRKMWTAYWRWFMGHPDETVFYHLFRDWSGFPEYERRRDTSHFASYIQSIKLIAAQCPNLCSIPVDLFCLYVLNMTIMSAKLVAQGTLENSKETESAVFALIMHGLAGLLAGT